VLIEPKTTLLELKHNATNMLQEEELQLIESVQDSDMQTGTKLFACHKLLKELDNVDTC
jgi:hypothetical protein